MRYYLRSKTTKKYATEKDYEYLVEANDKKSAKTFTEKEANYAIKFDADLEKEVEKNEA